MTSLSIKLSQRQIEYLRKVKAEHGISMAASIRNLIMRDMYGQGKIRRTGSKKTRSVRSTRSGPSGYSACVRELNAVFEKRKAAVE